MSRIRRLLAIRCVWILSDRLRAHVHVCNHTACSPDDGSQLAMMSSRLTRVSKAWMASQGPPRSGVEFRDTGPGSAEDLQAVRRCKPPKKGFARLLGKLATPPRVILYDRSGVPPPTPRVMCHRGPREKRRALNRKGPHRGRKALGTLL